MIETTEITTGTGHEQVVRVVDTSVGLRAVIAIHSTALGPSLGGIRFWRYPDADAALRDVLRLSEAMTLKAAAAGLHQGGGKAVVHWADPHAVRPRALLHALGCAINALGGRYLAAEDVGATTRDMDLIAEVTPWVTGVSESVGGSGDPSPVTAFGVLCGMRAALKERFGDPSLAGRQVLVQGAGKVGAALVSEVVREGASVAVADVDASRVQALVRRHVVRPVPAADALFERCDVLAPCALGGVLTEASARRLRCAVVCGGANNQLASASVDDLLAEQGVLYAPDFVVNAGGVINIAEEFVGYSRERALARTACIEQTTARVFTLAHRWGVAPGRAALRMARERLRRDALPGGRWEPGDPTAWTNGAPLTRLRPG